MASISGTFRHSTPSPWLAISTLSTSTHAAMLLGMLALMLYRHDQYAQAR
jgi:hypothetical protein